MFAYSRRSLKRMNGIHPKLVAILFLMAKSMDLTIIEGVRSKERQDKLFRDGFSKVKYPNSKHNVEDGELFARAVDVVPADTLYENISNFEKMGELLKRCSKEINVEIDWGGDWNWKDYAHIQLKDTEL